MMDDLRRSRVACTVLGAAMTVSALGVCALADTLGLPPITPFEKEWRLHQGKLAGPRLLVVRSAKEWAELWKQHAPGDAGPPAVDFASHMVVGIVGARGKPLRCIYRIKLDDPATPTEFRVHISHDSAISQWPKTVHLKGARVHLVATGKSALPVRFIQDDMVDAGVMSLTCTAREGGRTVQYAEGVRQSTLGRAAGARDAAKDKRPAAYREQAEQAVQAFLAKHRRAGRKVAARPGGMPSLWRILEVYRTPTEWHVRYGDRRFRVAVDTGEVIEGK